MNFLAQKRKKILLQDSSPTPSKNNPFDDFYYKEIAQLTGAGGYCIDFANKVTYIDPQGQHILKTPPNFKPSLNTLIRFYADEEKERTIATFMNCSQGKPFTTIVKMVTYTGEEFWAKAVGKPMYNAANTIVGVQGVFQNINKEKHRELKLQESMNTIANQNSRLFNYANLVSHNLKSHASNISMSLELLSDTKDPAESQELLEVLHDISKELSKTIHNLSDVVSIQETAKIAKKEVAFEDVIILAKQQIELKLGDYNVQLYTDFSEAPTVEYINSYLVDIMVTLLLRAIEYRHPDRTPSINIFSLEEDGKTTLLFRDNGIGITLEEENQKAFDLKYPLTGGSETQNVALFQIKNKINAMGGTISVDSEPERGTVFTITF